MPGVRPDHGGDAGAERSVPSLALDNVETVVRIEEQSILRRTRGERISDVVAQFAGTFTFVAVHVVLFAAWAIVNAIWPTLIGWDPYPFALLNLIVSIEAVLLSAFVLNKQNRMSQRADRRAHLDLQINMLTEREVTKALQLLARIGEHVGMDTHETDDELREMGRATAIDELARSVQDKMPD